MTEWTGTSTTSLTEDFQGHDNADNEHFRSGNSAKLTSNTSTTVYDNSTDTEGKTVSHTFWVYGNSGETFTTEDFTIVYDGGTQTNTEATTHTLSLTGWNVVIHEYAVPDNVTSYQFRIKANSTTIWVDDYEANINDFAVSSAELDVLSFTDYYAFGMTMGGRNHSSDEYRYGFNGMEKDDEVKGDGNHYDYGARMYDSRIGRWFSRDRLESSFPFASPYNFVLGKPITFTDPDGNSPQFHDVYRKFMESLAGTGIETKVIGPMRTQGYRRGGKPKQVLNWHSNYVEIELKYKEGDFEYTQNIKFQYSDTHESEVEFLNKNCGLDTWKAYRISYGYGDYKYWQGFKNDVERYGQVPPIINIIAHLNPLITVTEAITGEDITTGRKLAGWERALNLLDALPVVGKMANKGIKTAIYKFGGKSFDLMKQKGRDALRKLACVTKITEACFVEGTLVKTSKGDKPIEKIESGDLVWSFNEQTGETELKRVYNPYSRDSITVLYNVLIENELIQVTDEHPFYVNNEWVKAKDLQVGDSVYLFANDLKLTIKHLERIDTFVKVYNFTVEDNHNYFVARTGILVHNTCWETFDYNKIKLGILSSKVNRKGKKTFTENIKASNAVRNTLKDIIADNGKAVKRSTKVSDPGFWKGADKYEVHGWRDIKFKGTNHLRIAAQRDINTGKMRYGYYTKKDASDIIEIK